MSTLPSIRELLSAVFRNTRWIALAVIVPPAIAIAASFMMPKVYQADAKLLIKPGREFAPAASVGQNEFALPSSTMSEIIKSEVEILNSKDLAQSTLQSISIGTLYPDLASGSNAAMERAVTRFGTQLQVDPIDLSNVVNVGFQSEDPEIPAKVLETLLADFQARHVNAYSGALTQPIETQIAAKQKDLEALDAKRIQYQNANGAFSIPEQRASLIQQRAQVQTLLHDAQIKEGALQKQVEFLKKSRSSTPKTAAIESETDPTTGASGEATQQLMALRQKEQEMLQRYQPTAPALVQLRSQIAQAEQFVKEAQTTGSSAKVRTGANPLMAQIDQQLLTAQSDLTPIDAQIDGYNTQIASFDDQLKKLQDSELEVNNLQRQIESLTADLQNLRSNLEQARFAANMDQAKVSSVSVIDAPRLEPRPVFPKKSVFGVAGVAIGILIAGLITLLSLAFGNTVITVEGAERIFGVPVVAALPDLKPLPAK